MTHSAKYLIAFGMILATAPSALAGIDHAQDTNWRAAVLAMGTLSARQHHGTVAHGRRCEPEARTCSDAVFYISKDGTGAFLLAVKNAKGVLIQRLACHLNAEQDVKTCVDFDTNEPSTFMKNTSGEWEDIGGGD